MARKRLQPKRTPGARPSGEQTSGERTTGEAAAPAKKASTVPVGATTRQLSDLIHPKLLDDGPRANLTKVRLRYGISAAIVVVLTTLGLMTYPPSLIPGVLGLLIGGTYALFTWGDSRAFMQTDGDQLSARWIRRTYRVRGQDVSRVQYLFNGKYPDFRLVTSEGRALQVPASRIASGHTTLFAWLVVYAPHAIWDRRSVLFLQSMDEQKAL